MSGDPRDTGSGQPASGSGEGPVEIVAEEIRPADFRPSAGGPSGPSRRIQPRSLMVAGLGSLLLALAYLSFTSLPVRLDIEPEPEWVDLPETWLKFSIGDRYLLRAGQHQLEAGRQGFHRLAVPFEVVRGKDNLFAFELRALPGQLDIRSSPVDGAAVSIDGVVLGATPLIAEVEGGSRRIEVRAPRHLPASLSVEVEGRGARQELRVELTPDWAPVVIESSPRAAAVLIDGEERGRTPAELEVASGTHALELRLPGHATHLQSFEVVANLPLRLEPIALQPADARLRIVSQPAGAQVLIGDRSRGRTPLETQLSSGDAHEIQLLKPGYERLARTLTLEAGEEREIHLSLKARRGEVTLVTSPRGAQVRIDGQDAGPGNQRLRLLATPHEIVVSKAGYRTKRLSVTPRPGFPQRIEIQLEKADEAALPSQTPTPLGRKLRLVPPGSFVMGSRRGQVGARPNEVQRNVQLTRPFYIGVTEVTNAEYRRFASDHVSPAYSGFDMNGDDQPVVGVTWQQAAHFCNWLSRQQGLPMAYVERAGGLELVEPVGTGYRLPSEAEWAWAARFAAGSATDPYPWGTEPRPPAGSDNYADASAAGIVPAPLMSYSDGFEVSAPVGTGRANALGLYDVGGNVAEWVHDRYMIFSRRPGAPAVRDPFGAQSGQLRVIRGSSWRQSSPTELRLAYRDYGKEARPDVGFRLARYAR